MAVDIIARGIAAGADASAQTANTRLDNLPKGVVYRGSVNYYNDLPNDAEIGDTYTVKYKGTEGTQQWGAEFAWGLDTATGENTWIEFGNPVEWGEILGTLSNQTDLRDALDLKADAYTEMPAASAANLGQVVQYTGTTTDDYINGYFYKCVSDGATPANYTWDNIQSQDHVILDYFYDDDTYKSGTASVKSRIREEVGKILTLYKQRNIFPYIRMRKFWDRPSKTFIPIRWTFPDNWNSETLEFKYWYWSSYAGQSSYNHAYEMMESPVVTFTATYDSTTDIIQVTNISVQNYNYYVLSGGDKFPLPKDNTVAFTPTGDYNPATKKYVDDSITAAAANQFWDGDLAEWEALTPEAQNTYWVAVVDASAPLSTTDINTLQSVTGSQAPIISDIREEEAIEITNEIIGGNA